MQSINLNNVKTSVYSTYQDISYDIKDIKDRAYFNLQKITVKTSVSILFSIKDYKITYGFSRALTENFINPAKWQEALNMSNFCKEQGHENLKQARNYFNQMITQYNKFENKFHGLYEKYKESPIQSIEKQYIIKFIEKINQDKANINTCRAILRRSESDYKQTELANNYAKLMFDLSKNLIELAELDRNFR